MSKAKPVKVKGKAAGRGKKASGGETVSAPIRQLLTRYPDTELLEILFADINGILRGKRVGRTEFEKAFEPGINLPGATALLDNKGMTFSVIPNGSMDGDPDMNCQPVPGTTVPTPWAARPTAQTMVTMYQADGRPYFADPRHVLARATAPFQEMGLTPVIAIELEFYLLDGNSGDVPRPMLARVPGTSLAQGGPQYNSLDDLVDLDSFFSEVDAACKLQGIPASAALAEFAAGQYEINLHHVDDPFLACAHALMLKRAVKGVARKHGMAACFMAKPFADSAGSGLHVHVSVLDRNGKNIFSGPKSRGTEPSFSAALRYAIGGLVVTMEQSMAIFAPNANSYRRLQPASFVPLTPNWGLNHRRLALRIPMSAQKDMRVEHRVAGADANPYLVVAAILAGIHHGIVEHCDPGPMVPTGTIIEEEVTLPTRWELALSAFDNATVIPRYLGEDFARVFGLCRREESDRFHAEVGRQDYEWYLRNV